MARVTLDADTLATFRAFLEEMWMDNTEEEALALWRRRIRRTPAYVDDALAALDRVLADPPPDLREQLEQHGWIALRHREPAGQTPYTHDETVDWLRAMTARFRAVAQEQAR
jgi:hypothetical protein